MAMKELGIRNKLIKLVKITMTQINSTIRFSEYHSETPNVTNGLHQGDALACHLFNTAQENVAKGSGKQT